MPSIISEQDKTSNDLKSLYRELGQKAVAWHRAIAYSPSNETYSTLSGILEEKNQIVSEIQAVNSSINEVKQSISSLEGLDRKLRTLYSSIGAVCVEMNKAGRLSQSLYPCMQAYYDYLREDQELSDKVKASNPLTKKLNEIKLRKHRNELENVFCKTGEEFVKADCTDELTSEKAKSLITQARDVIALRDESTNTIRDNDNTFQTAEAKRIKALETRLDVINESLGLLYEEYGEILSKGMDSWLDPLAPQELQDACSLITDQKRRIREQKLNMQLLSYEKEIEVHQGQTEQLAAQLTHLNSQMTLIERQKNEIQIKIEEEKKAVEELKAKQKEISSKF